MYLLKETLKLMANIFSNRGSDQINPKIYSTMMQACINHTLFLSSFYRETPQSDTLTEEIMMRLAQQFSVLCLNQNLKKYIYSELNRRNILRALISESQVPKQYIFLRLNFNLVLEQSWASLVSYRRAFVKTES